MGDVTTEMEVKGRKVSCAEVFIPTRGGQCLPELLTAQKPVTIVPQSSIGLPKRIPTLRGRSDARKVRIKAGKAAAGRERRRAGRGERTPARVDSSLTLPDST